MTLGELLAELPRIAQEENHADLPALIGKLAEAQAEALARLMTPSKPAISERLDPRQLLTVDQALARLSGVFTRRTLLRLTRGKSFRKSPTRKSVLFEEAGLMRWITSHS